MIDTCLFNIHVRMAEHDDRYIIGTKLNNKINRNEAYLAKSLTIMEQICERATRAAFCESKSAIRRIESTRSHLDFKQLECITLCVLSSALFVRFPDSFRTASRPFFVMEALKV